ncbi:hypothetical protein ACFV1G_15285 [Streptomyces anulatus]|uniref:hypothetical protein n=1 Tax=Streptomyces anulatus TaxID=1892 RepID=UPI0036CC55D4
MGILLQAPSDHDRNRALDIFDRVTEKAGHGIHGLTLSVAGINGQASVLFPFMQDDDGMTARDGDLYPFCELLAVALTGAHPSGLVLRTVGEPQAVRGWRFTDGDPMPLNRAEAFNAYCTDATTGEPIPPDPNTEYEDAFVIHL